MLLYFYNLKLISRTKPSRENSFTQRVEKYNLLNLVETFYGLNKPKKVRNIEENYQISWIEAENSERNIYATR